MELKLDLHVHSAASPDGRMSLTEIVESAKAKGLHGVAICDHDILYEPESVECDPEFLVIPGIECSTQYGHILGLFLTKSVERTDAFGMIDEIHAQGGLAVLAHPFARNRDEARLEAVLPFLDGAEVWNGRANRKNPRANLQAAHFAKEKGLLPFAGSDAHVRQEVGNGYVCLQAEERSLSAVKTALLTGNYATGGTEGRHIHVAQSQRTKLKKTKASAGKRLKWWLFAAKCMAEDLLRKIKISHD